MVVAALVALVLMKYCYEGAMERISREKAKRSRRGKKKRKEDLEGDGLGFAGGVTYSDSDDDDV